MRAIRTWLAGNATIDAYVVLAGKARNAIVGVIATRIDAQTAADALVALIGRIAAVRVVLAGAATRDETTREILAARRKTDFAHRAWVVGVAQRVRVWTGRAERARGAPRAIGSAFAAGAASSARAANSARAAVSSHAPGSTNSAGAAINATVQIDAGIAFRAGRKRRSSGFTTTGRSCSGQKNASKETHSLDGNLRRIAPLPGRRTPAIVRWLDHP